MWLGALFVLRGEGERAARTAGLQQAGIAQSQLQLVDVSVRMERGNGQSQHCLTTGDRRIANCRYEHA